MKRRISIAFAVGANSLSHVRTVLRRLGCTKGFHDAGSAVPGNYFHTFDESDPSLKPLLIELQATGIRVRQRIEECYSDAEYHSFPLLVITPERQALMDGIRYGTQYDMRPACAHCGTGALQTSALILPKQALRTKMHLFSTTTNYVVSEPLAIAMREAQLTGLRLDQVVGFRSGVKVPWWQLRSTSEMPRLDPRTTGLVLGDPPPCRVCQRNNRYHHLSDPLVLVYDRRNVRADDLPDVVSTWECLAHSFIYRDDFRKSRFATPMLLIRPRVLDVLRNVGVKRVRINPVRIE